MAQEVNRAKIIVSAGASANLLDLLQTQSTRDWSTSWVCGRGKNLYFCLESDIDVKISLTCGVDACTAGSQMPSSCYAEISGTQDIQDATICPVGGAACVTVSAYV